MHPLPYTANNCMHSSTQSLRASHKGKKEGWLSVDVVAQWQSAGSLSQRPWVQLLAAAPLFLPLITCLQRPWFQLPVAPPFFRALFRFKGLQTVTTQIVSLIKLNHYWSSDHRGVPSIVLLPAVICSRLLTLTTYTANKCMHSYKHTYPFSQCV